MLVIIVYNLCSFFATRDDHVQCNQKGLQLLAFFFRAVLENPYGRRIFHTSMVRPGYGI